MGLFENENKTIEFLLKIFSGEIDLFKLPNVLYYYTADKLKKGLYKGYGDTLLTVDGIEQTKLLQNLRESVYIFSGAKTFNYVLSTKNLLIQNGKLATKEEFIEQALKINKLYNQTWLETEYNTCLGQGQVAEQWQDIQSTKEFLPFIKYYATPTDLSDARCLKKNGLILPVDDPFWNENSPLTHYNCACKFQKMRKKEDNRKAPTDIEENDKGLRTNAGKTGVVFDKSHPYFDVPKEFEKYAKNNFNFNIPKND